MRRASSRQSWLEPRSTSGAAQPVRASWCGARIAALWGGTRTASDLAGVGVVVEHEKIGAALRLGAIEQRLVQIA
jgi:hypothetical protein